ncbi:run domain Beclin-1-interacting and cysteine-rich domain-containing protein isoform X1 [Brienomyrus brachyistius]|uniref:run domain Beclin-1-interacting and cysteine-rich domain-containing protein isoform X1 n=2 Tax=Brienomyrus brachyistius TaxID=42636 RepID=UPI0020B3940B|nr:run domain Beclin-1-interacting and cysteine-rich domain-containing protein isoform X1 [Brienomyrus brachyistius]
MMPPNRQALHPGHHEANGSMTRAGRRCSSMYRRERWKLLSSLKTTVEGLLSTNNPNVWSRYGGLQRLHKDFNNILSHGLKQEQVYSKQKDFWRFVWCIRQVSPHLAVHVEQFSHLEPVLGSGAMGVGEAHKAERWLLHSLQVHCLSGQLRPLLKCTANTRKFYNDEAFLLSEPHVGAMFQCLEAVEQNDPRLLALVDTGMLSSLREPLPGLPKSHSLCMLPLAGGGGLGGLPPRCLTVSQSSLQDGHTGSLLSDGSSGAPWACRSGQQGPPDSTSSPPEPQISVTEASPTQPGDVGDSADGDLDDGPEYLAIGNLGRRRWRRDSAGSASGVTGEGPAIRSTSTTLAPPPVRCSSFTEGLGTSVRSSRGHSRSLSDTGVALKHGQGGRHRNITVIVEDPIAESSSSSSNGRAAKDHGSFSASSGETGTLGSLYMESEGSQHSGTSESMFRRPSKGQSLISYLSEQDFGSCADLEKENAHFSISESLIAAIELMKCNLRRRPRAGEEDEEEEEGDSDCEIQQLKQKIRLRRQQIRSKRDVRSQRAFTSTGSASGRSSQNSVHLSDSASSEDIEECELKDDSEGGSLLVVSRNGLSLSLASLFSDADIRRGAACTTSSGRSFLSSESISPSLLQSNSAESVAMGLLRQFEGMQLPAASEFEWLVPEHDAPQKLLPLPKSLPISPDDGEHADIYKLRIRVRGNLEWAPPRPQIIFNIHAAPKRKVVVAKQNYRCAGCGIRIDPDFIKRLRYCEYLGRYFCQCCHDNAQAVVPGRVLKKWDFSKYPVSNFARDLLGKIASDPLFNPNDVNGGLYKKVKALESVRLLRLQLSHMKVLLKTCRFATKLLDQFDAIPCHLTEDLHLFSLNDLKAVRKGELGPRLQELLRQGTAHVADCVLCQAKGFVCEFCGNDQDIIFPFELSKCRACEECHACYHRGCFRAGLGCPRCRRFAERREKLARRNMEDQEDEGGG